MRLRGLLPGSKRAGRTCVGLALAFAAALAAIEATPAGAFGQAPPQPTGEGPAQWIDRAVALRRAHTRAGDEAAHALLLRAVEAQPSPRALAQLGLVEQALGRWVEAEGHLRAALASRGDPWLEGRRSALAAPYRAVLQNTAEIELSGGPDDAELLVNGAPRGTLGASRRVRIPTGSVSIEVRAHGYEPFERRVNSSAGGLLRQPVELLAVRVAPTVVGPEPAVAAAPRRIEVIPVLHVAPVSRVSPLRSAGWGLFVGGGAVALGATVALGVWRGNVGGFNANGACGADGASGVVVGGEPCERAYATGTLARTLSVAGYALGGVVAATGLVLVLAAPAPRAPVASARGDRPRWICGPVFSATGLSCAGEF